MREHYSGQRERKPILGARDFGVENLIAGAPAEHCDDLPGLRTWTKGVIRDAGQWEITRGQERARNRLARGR